MALMGLSLTVLAGRTIPIPLPGPLVTRLRSVHVTATDRDPSVFTLTLDAGRAPVAAALDVPGLENSPLQTFSRIVIMARFGVKTQVVLDGIVTELRLTPGTGPGAATLTITGEDVSYLLDRVERDVEHIGLNDYLQVQVILARYLMDGIVPQAVPPLTIDPALPIDRVPTQHGTDLEHLTDLAHRHGFVAYMIPGPLPGQSRFYWGPPVRLGVPQAALSVDLGPETNVLDLKFRTEALKPKFISGGVMDRRTGGVEHFSVERSERLPLSAASLWSDKAQDIRMRRLRNAGSDVDAARAAAQAEVDRSIDAVVAEGELDGARYGGVLRPGGLVGLRGAGMSHDGLWYVQTVEHSLAPGSYRQKFTLAREGYGPTMPVVPVQGVG